MKCIKCGQEMTKSDTGLYSYCTNCDCVIDDLVYREPTAKTFEKMPFKTKCLICGVEMATNLEGTFLGEAVVCDDCKKAITWVKENMKE